MGWVWTLLWTGGGEKVSREAGTPVNTAKVLADYKFVTSSNLFPHRQPSKFSRDPWKMVVGYSLEFMNSIQLINLITPGPVSVQEEDEAGIKYIERDGFVLQSG